MTTRRAFIKNSGALALGSLLAPGMMKGMSYHTVLPTKEIGIQTFTVNSFIGSDPKAIFQQLAEIGFKNIETASYGPGSYYGYKPAGLKSLFESLDMKWIGHHVLGVPMQKLFAPPKNATPEQQKQAEQMLKNFESMKIPNLTDNMQQLVDEAAEGGLQYLICAATAIKTLDDIKAAVDTFGKAGETCRKAGIQFAYHNHATEWDPVEGTTAYDYILSHTDKGLVMMELDLGWVATAKKDPVTLFKGNPGRFPLWHVKDFDLATNTIVPIGKGTIDFKPAFAAADLAGMHYFFYEQDTARSIDDVKLSFANLKKIL